MHCLPVIQRELQVAARSKATFQQRMLAGGVASALVVLFALFTPSLSSTSGHYLFQVVSWGGFVVCFLQGLRETSDAISMERREETLGLLFLTDLNGYDVVLGKLAAAAVKSFTMLLAMTPAFALPIWLGGVTAGEFWRVTATFATTLLFSMATGIFVSALSRNAFATLIGAFLLASMLILVPAASIAFHGPLPEWLAGPISMLLFSSDSQFPSHPSLFWSALLYSGILCALFFVFAGRRAKQFAYGNESAKGNSLWQRLLRPTAGYSSSWGGMLGMEDPAVWWAERNLPGRKILWGLAGDTTIFIVFAIEVLFLFMMKLWVAVLAVQPFNTARRSGALELLLCTPMPPGKLVRGQMDALRGYFILPGFIASVGPVLAGFIGSAMIFPKSTGFGIMVGLGLGVWCFICFLLDLNALAYLGLWLGLTEQQIPKAVAKNVSRVLLLSWATQVIPCVGIFGVFIVPGFWIGWARKKLNERLHHEAASQYAADAQNVGWFKSMFS